MSEQETTAFRQHTWWPVTSTEAKCRRCGMTRHFVGVNGRRSMFSYSDDRGVIPTRNGKLPRGCNS